MPLDPQAQAILHAGRTAGAAPMDQVPVEETRRQIEEIFTSSDAHEEVHSVEDLDVPGPVAPLRLRLYRPSESKDLGCLVLVHGGGWTINSLETHDYLSRRLANLAQAVVLSVEYRLSPEDRYPAALEDVSAALQFAFASGSTHGWDPSRVGVVGDSSGGTLATAAVMLNRDRGGPEVAIQALVYPVTDYYEPASSSYAEYASGYTLTKDLMVWFWGNYLADGADLDDPYLCPLRAEDLSGMPPTLVVTAEYDPLRDEGRAYAERLEKAGAEVEHWHYETQMHGFLLQERAIDRAREAVDRLGERLRRALG